MLSELRETNKELREKLQELRKESSRLCLETERYLSATNAMDPSYSSPRLTVTRRNFSNDETAPAPCGRATMLSDRAKHIRGEASKRIDSLLHDWREYKERADEEIRRRYRAEQNLREMLTRKEREVNEMTRELGSLRLVSVDQKKLIEQLSNQVETESKCRVRCTDLEMQVTKQNQYINELTDNVRSRDELVRTCEAEREALMNANADLRSKNLDQKNKIEMCEQDVNETRMELEILEEMVRALNERKSTILHSNQTGTFRTPTPTVGLEFGPSARHTPLTPPRSIIASTPPAGYRVKDDVIPLSFNMPLTTEASSQQSEFQPKHHLMSSNADDMSQSGIERRSAMHALRSLQKEHSAKCEYLAEHIRKLKEENKEKEKTISELKTSTKKTAP